jgi:hypothetical protein
VRPYGGAQGAAQVIIYDAREHMLEKGAMTAVQANGAAIGVPGTPPRAAGSGGEHEPAAGRQ